MMHVRVSLIALLCLGGVIVTVVLTARSGTVAGGTRGAKDGELGSGVTPSTTSAGRYLGRVIDERGEPCVGYSVRVARRAGAAPAVLPDDSTSSEGSFNVEDLVVGASGSGRIEVRNPEGVLVHESAIVHGEDSTIQVRRRPFRVRGAVRGELPKEEVRLRLLFYFTDAVDSEREIIATLGENGAFAVDTHIPLDQARPQVVARLVGEGLHSQRTLALPDLIDGRAIIDAPSAAVTLRATRAGQPVLGARLALALDADTPSWCYHTLRAVGPGGDCRLLTDLGQLSVWVIAQGEPITFASAAVTPTGSNTIVVELGSSSYSISGRVLDPGLRPRAGTMVFCLPVTRHAGVFNTFLTDPFTTDAAGTFKMLFGGAAQTYHVFAQSAAAMSPIAQVRGGASFDIVFDDSKSDLHSTVTGLATDALVWDHCTLVAVTEGRASARAVWGALDHMSINMAAERIEQLYLAGPGYRTLASGAYDARLREVSFVLAPAPVVQLHVRNSDGAPLANAAVLARWHGHPTLPWENAVTNSDGYCQLRLESFDRRFLGLEIVTPGGKRLIDLPWATVQDSTDPIVLSY